MEVSGQVQIGMGWETQDAIERRTIGSSGEAYGLVGGLVIGGTIFGYYLWVPNPMLGAVVGGFAGVVAHYPVYRWARLRAWRKALKARYDGTDFPLTVACTAEGLLYTFGDIRRAVGWRCVTDLFASNGYWIFIAQSTPLFVPQRLFADQAAERAFIAEALSYMEEAARARSPGAVEFVAKA